MSFTYYEDPILGKGRAQVDTGSGGSGGSSYVGGDRINIGGGTISFVNSADIVNVTGTSVTLQPDTAYKIYATSQAITLNANPPASGKWAYEGHIELFVAGTGYVVTGSNVVLANALEPDAVNNCTVRFHDGIAIIAVEDHVAGYIVVNGSTAGDGSLYYGITTSTNDYVAFDASLNGTVIPLAGAVAEGEKHIVGNGYTETAISGNIDCSTNKVTVANLSLQDVGITGGTLTLGDAFIPSGSTVAVSGGRLAVEKVTGAGSDSVIDLGMTVVSLKSGSPVYTNGCIISGGSSDNSGAFQRVANTIIDGFDIRSCRCTYYGGAFDIGYAGAQESYSATLTNGSITGCTAGFFGGACYIAGNNAVVDITGCTMTGNYYRGDGQLRLNDIHVGANGIVNVKDSTIGDMIINGSATINGRNTLDKITGSGLISLTSGASINLTSSINPGGGIVVEAGGCTVNGVAVAGGTYTSIVSSGGSAVVNN